MRVRNSVNLKPVGVIELLVTHTAAAQLHVYISAVAKHVPGILFLVQFNNFDQTVGFYWSYTLLL